MRQQILKQCVNKLKKLDSIKCKILNDRFIVTDKSRYISLKIPKLKISITLNSLCKDNGHFSLGLSTLSNQKSYSKNDLDENNDYNIYYSYWVDEKIKDDIAKIWGLSVDKIEISETTLKNLVLYNSYYKSCNDRESAIVGVDKMKLGDHDQWIEDKAITSKVTRTNKLNTFISNKYKEEIQNSKSQLFNGKNNFNFSSKCNACLGYCVEYYSKYLIFGEALFNNFINEALKESNLDDSYRTSPFIIIRACMLCYRHQVVRTFGSHAAKFVRTLSVSLLIKNSYKIFVDTIINLGTKVAEFIKQECPDIVNKDSNGLLKITDPNLSINHISGLADYISEDTIIDIKTTNNITAQHVKQVLGYHYLSTKRSDLHINKVIIFDAVSGKHLTINISLKNIKYFEPLDDIIMDAKSIFDNTVKSSYKIIDIKKLEKLLESFNIELFTVIPRRRNALIDCGCYFTLWIWFKLDCNGQKMIQFYYSVEQPKKYQIPDSSKAREIFNNYFDINWDEVEVI